MSTLKFAFSTIITHRRTVRHVDTKFPCWLPQDHQPPPCCRSAASGVYLFDLRRLITHPTGDLRRRIDFSPCYSRAAGKSRTRVYVAVVPSAAWDGASCRGFVERERTRPR